MNEEKSKNMEVRRKTVHVSILSTSVHTSVKLPEIFIKKLRLYNHFDNYICTQVKILVTNLTKLPQLLY